MSDNPDTAPESELQEIVAHVFSRPPGPPRSVWLDFTRESLDDFPSDSEREAMLLRMYVDIAYLGCERLWGQEFSWQNLTRDQYDLLQRYMNSFGVKLNIRCNEENEDPWDVAEQQGIDAVKFLRFSIDILQPTSQSTSSPL